MFHLKEMIEKHEEDIEEWYFDHKAEDITKDDSGSASLENFLCRQGRMLKTKSDRLCLDDGKSKKSKKYNSFQVLQRPSKQT